MIRRDARRPGSDRRSRSHHDRISSSALWRSHSQTDSPTHHRRLAAANAAAYEPALAIVAEQPLGPVGGGGAPRRGPDRDRGSRHRLPAPGGRQPRRLRTRPRDVAEQPLDPVGGGGAPRRGPGRDRGSRHRSPAPGGRQPRRLRTRPRDVAEQPLDPVGGGGAPRRGPGRDRGSRRPFAGAWRPPTPPPTNPPSRRR